MKIIEKVCKKISKRFKFSYYDSDDVYQESYLICYNLLDKWDGRNLENFLNNSASNNMRSLIKQKIGSSNEKIKELKQSIDTASPIDSISVEQLPYYYIRDNLHEKLLFEQIESGLPIEYRKNYLKMKSGNRIQFHKKDEILNYIRESFVQSVLHKAETVYELDEGIPFSSGILSSDEYGYIVKYDERI